MSDRTSSENRRTPLRVLYWPKWPGQPYLEDLAAGLADAAVDSQPLTARNLLRHGRSVVHIHWPETIVSGLLRLPRGIRPCGRAARLVTMTIVIALVKLRRQALIVTLHNLEPHDSDKRLPVFVLRQVARRADVVVTLSPGGAERARWAHPELRDSTIEVVPLMDFAERYPPTDRGAARTALGISPDVPLVLFVGRVHPYKGVEQLISSFLELEGSPHLLILGRGDLTDPGLTELLPNHDRVQWRNEWASEHDITNGLAAADLVVLPFRNIENSASAMAAITSGAPVLVPDLEPMRELADEFGPDRVRTYAGDLSPETLRRHLDAARGNRRSRPSAPHRTTVAVGARQREVYVRAVELTGRRGRHH